MSHSCFTRVSGFGGSLVTQTVEGPFSAVSTPSVAPISNATKRRFRNSITRTSNQKAHAKSVMFCSVIGVVLLRGPKLTVRSRLDRRRRPADRSREGLIVKRLPRSATLVNFVSLVISCYFHLFPMILFCSTPRIVIAITIYAYEIFGSMGY